MTTILNIESSAMQHGSKTRAANAIILDHLPYDKRITRDLTAPLPQITEDWAKARLVAKEDRTQAEREVLALSDSLIAELQAADTILIGLPIYNFGMPAALKAWIDLVARPKVTFEYSSNGPRGLLTGKKAIITVASGGTAVNSAIDFATPHLVQVLKFIGITDTTVVDTKDPAWQDQFLLNAA